MDITVGGPRLDLGGVLPNHSFNLWIGKHFSTSKVSPSEVV